MEEWFVSTIAKLTPGGVGIWVLVAMAAVAWWKGLPAVLEAWSSSVSKERDHREREIERLERQIIAGDKRHDECLEGQRILREEVNRLQGLISGMVLQMRQLQLSAGDGALLQPDFAAMLRAMDRAPETKK